MAPDGTTVVILQSPDEVTVRHRTSGKRVTLGSHGDSTTAYPDGVLTEPGPAPGWARAMLLEMADLLRIDPVHIERDHGENALVIEASIALPAPPAETPVNDQVSEPTSIVAPEKRPPVAEPREPPLTVSKARALERAGMIAAGPAQAGGLARANGRADVRAEGSRHHGNGDRDGSHASGAHSGRSETASASSDGGESDGGGQGSGGDDGQAASSGGDNDSNGRGRSDRGGKGDGKGSGKKGGNRR